jgi:hypothetical protein
MLLDPPTARRDAFAQLLPVVPEIAQQFDQGTGVTDRPNRAIP